MLNDYVSDTIKHISIGVENCDNKINVATYLNICVDLFSAGAMKVFTTEN